MRAHRGWGLRAVSVSLASILVGPAFLGLVGCGLFPEPARVEDAAGDFIARVRSGRGNAFGRVRSARRGVGPLDVRVVMEPGWGRRKLAEREGDALILARTWVGIIQPVEPAGALLEFVDSAGRVLAWGYFQKDKGLFLRVEEGR